MKQTKLAYQLDDATLEAQASLAGDALTVGKARYELRAPSPEEVLLRLPDGQVVRAFVAEVSDETHVSIGGRVLRLRRARAGGRRGHAAHDAALEAPMPGTCRDVFVKPGDPVEKGARLVLIEAMKMEHELRAPRAGTVKAVHVAKGGPVAPGSPLVELDP